MNSLVVFILNKQKNSRKSDQNCLVITVLIIENKLNIKFRDEESFTDAKDIVLGKPIEIVAYVYSILIQKFY